MDSICQATSILEDLHGGCSQGSELTKEVLHGIGIPAINKDDEILDTWRPGGNNHQEQDEL